MPPQQSRHEPIDEPRHNDPLVLVADDEFEIRTLLHRVLEPLRYRVVTVASSLHAIEALWELPDVACVIADQRMQGPSGASLLDYVARERPGTGRILFTGWLNPTVADEARRHSIVEKTAPLHELVVAIEREINLRSRVTQ
jgi:DNA-binding NtrC family response regulator